MVILDPVTLELGLGRIWVTNHNLCYWLCSSGPLLSSNSFAGLWLHCYRFNFGHGLTELKGGGMHSTECRSSFTTVLTAF